MNFRFLFLALSLVAGGNALRFGSGAKSGVKENAGIDLLAVCAGMTTIRDTMTSQGCFNTSWSTNDTIFHTQLVTMCANCDAAAHFSSLKALTHSCLDTDAELVKLVAMAGAACATKTGSSVLCAEPIVRELKLGGSGPKNQTVLETACGGDSCPTEYITKLKDMTARCNAEADSLAFMHICLKDGNTYCYEDLSKAEFESTAKFDTFCKAPCSKVFYDEWSTKSMQYASCYANQTLAVGSDLYCRVSSNGTNCLDMIKTYTPDPHATCTTQMGADEGTWSYCNGTCKTQMETLFTDLGCCAETFIQKKVDNEKNGVAATKWLKDTCSITAAATVCALDVYTPPVVTTVKPSVNTTTAKPDDMGNKTTVAETNGTKTTPSPTKTPCDKCKKEEDACTKIDDCLTMVMTCYASKTTEKFEECVGVKPLKFDHDSKGFKEANEWLECHYCDCAKDTAMCSGYAEPTPPEATSSSIKISIIAVMFVASLSSLKLLF